MSQTPASEDLTRLLSQAAWARRLARALVSAGDAEDLCQDAWLKAVQQPAVGQPRAWLATVLRNLARNHRRGGARRRTRENETPAAEAVPTPEQSLGRMEIQRLLSDRVAALEEPFRQTLLLRFFDELPAAAIADRLGVPAGTIRWRLKTAIDRLRADLDLRRPEWRRDWALVVMPAGLGAGTASASGAPLPSLSPLPRGEGEQLPARDGQPPREQSLGGDGALAWRGGAQVPASLVGLGPGAAASSSGVAAFPMLIAALLALGTAAAVVGVHAVATTPSLHSLPTPADLHARVSNLPASVGANANANANVNATVNAQPFLRPQRAADPASPGDPDFLTFEQLPQPLVQAFVAAQDRRFFKHDGVDIHAMARALFMDIRAGRVQQGGSTITQQLAKQSLDGERSFGRKLRQVILARELERTYSKEEILTLYLNRVFLGHGSYGVAAAARRYFGKTVSELDLGECALLAAQPHAPARTSPIAHPDAAREARNHVLDRMVTTEAITRAEADHWSSQPLHTRLR
jgi:RNA polymerase sigma factor (sigma-70 family)